MAHMIQTMAYAGAVPWHGLGNRVDSDASIDEWIEQAGLTWSVELGPVFYAPNGQPQLAEGRKAVYRSDTGELFNVASDRYKPVQPAEILEFFRDLTACGGMKVDTAGALKSGAIVWALAKNGREIRVGQDRIKPYLLLSTSHDGSQATRASFTSVRVVCNNTLQMSRRAESNVVAVRHNTDFDPERVKEQLGLIDDLSADFEADMQAMSRCRIDRPTTMAFLERLLGQHKDSGELTKQSKGQMELAYRSIHRSPGADLDECRDTAYGVLNGVTHYVDHAARAKSADNRLTSAWFGKGQNLKSTAYGALAQLATDGRVTIEADDFESRLDQTFSLRD